MGVPYETKPVVVDVPHAGRCYPRDFVEAARLPLRSLRRSEDAYVDRLFAQSVSLGRAHHLASPPRLRWYRRSCWRASGP